VFIVVLFLMFGGKIESYDFFGIGVKVTPILERSTSGFIPTAESGQNGIFINGKVWTTTIEEPNIYNVQPVSDNIFSNLTTEVDVQIDDNSAEFQGLMIRQIDDKNFYSFRITQDGQYSFDVWKTGEFSHYSILGPSSSAAIKTGRGEVNHLKVIANDNTFTLFINNEMIGSVTDDSFTEGKVGVVACTCNGASRSSVTFYNFSTGK